MRSVLARKAQALAKWRTRTGCDNGHGDAGLVESRVAANAAVGAIALAASTLEIPAVRQLLARVAVADSLIGIDARHTQQDTGRQVVQEAGADYLLTVKANRKSYARPWPNGCPHRSSFFPPPQPLPPHGAHTEEPHRSRTESRTLCTAPIPTSEPPAGYQRATYMRPSSSPHAPLRLRLRDGRSASCVLDKGARFCQLQL